MGRKKSSLAILSLAFQLDLERSKVRQQKDLNSNEIQSIVGLGSPEVLQSVKNILMTTHIGVTFFNSQYPQGKASSSTEKITEHN